MRYDNEYFNKINNNTMKYYMANSITDYGLTNTRTYNMTGGSIRRQYEYLPSGFIQSKEAEGRRLILNHGNVNTPSNYNYGGVDMPITSFKVRGKRMKGGDIFNDISNFFKPVASAALDLAAPAAGMFLGGPAGAVMATGARQGLKAVTGFGKAKRGGKKIAGVGVYAGSLNASDTSVGGAMSAGCNGDMACVPCSAKTKAKKGAAHPIGARLAGAKTTAGAKTAGAKTTNNRMDMVKKIMKEKKMNLGQASKYIAENNLYKKKTDK